MKRSLKERYGEWALVTGASSGIGEAFAHRLARGGMNLILVARRKERLEVLASYLTRKFHVKVVPVPLDLSAEGFLPRLSEAVGAREVGFLVNNAGFGSAGPFTERDPGRDADMVRLNCLAPATLAHHFIPPMLARRRGAVIFLASVVAYQPTPYMSAYAATKAFNLLLGEGLWYELREYGIDVLALSPGTTDTEFQEVAGMSRGPIVATPERVVATGMRALGRRPSVVDGRINKILSVIHRLVPRRLTLVLAGGIIHFLHSREGLTRS